MIAKGVLRRLTMVLVALTALAGVAGAQAPLTASFMPGFPMLAGNMVMVMWMPAPGAKEYKVYRNDALVLTTPANQYMDPADNLAGELRYQVTAVNMEGVEGPKSAPGVVKIIKIEPPQNLVVMELGGEVRVRWDSVAGAMVYNVYKAEAAEGPFSLATSVTGVAYPDPNLKPGQTSWYRVTAKDMSGKESGPSAVVSFKRPEAAAAAAEGKEVLYKRTETVMRVWDNLRDAADKPVPLRAPMELAVDPGGSLLYVATGGGNQIVLLRYVPAKAGLAFTLEGFYGPDGFGKEEEAAGRFQQLRAMALSPDGKTLAAIDSMANLIYVIDSGNGNILSKFDIVGDKAADKRAPRPVCLRFDDRGDLWVADAINDNFKIFDSSGKLLETKANSEVVEGVGYFVLDPANKRVVATNTGTRSVSVLDWDGKLIKKFGEVGVGAGKIWAPTGIDLLPDGTIVQADGINSIVNFFDLEGNLQYHLRNIDDDIFQTASTRGLAVRKNMIFITLATNDEVRVLRIQDELRKESEAKKE